MAPWGWPSGGGAVLYRLSPQLGEDPPVEDPGLCDPPGELTGVWMHGFSFDLESFVMQEAYGGSAALLKGQRPIDKCNFSL